MNVLPSGLRLHAHKLFMRVNRSYWSQESSTVEGFVEEHGQVK
jgi:hypothetical protein